MTKNSYVIQGAQAPSVSGGFDISESKANSYAENMLIYSNALTVYGKANTGFNGNIPDASISLPSWYLNLGFTNYMQNGMIYVYSQTPSSLNLPPTGNALSNINEAYALAGEVRSGQFYNVGTGVNTSITLPAIAAIPDGSPILITNVNSL